MKEQVGRLLIVVVIALVAFVGIRRLLIPETFGVKGHYRAAAEDSIAEFPIKFAGQAACSECHDDISQQKGASFHRGLGCEVCHGPANDHIESAGDILPQVPRARKNCEQCHAYDPAKPTGFPQIDPIAHNPVKPCITCHNPHAPDPPSAPDQCSACHGGIARTKALSPHAALECMVCHITPEAHFSNPRLNLPKKPASRESCSACHARSAEVDRFIPRVDMSSHGGKSLCWECHYPHYPEA